MANEYGTGALIRLAFGERILRLAQTDPLVKQVMSSWLQHDGQKTPQDALAYLVEVLVEAKDNTVKAFAEHLEKCEGPHRHLVAAESEILPEGDWSLRTSTDLTVPPAKSSEP